MLDSDDVPQSAAPPEARSAAPTEPAPSRPGSALRWWGVLLMLLALAALVWAAWKYVVHPHVFS